MSMFTKKPDNKLSDSREPSTTFAEKRESIAPVERPDGGGGSAQVGFAARTSSFIKGSSKMVPSIIGEDLTITGNITSRGEVQVDGEIQGDIHCQSLVIGEKATISGGVVAEDVIVRGRVLGSVRAQRITLQSTCHVEGDIFHQTLAIEQGAFFEGKSRRSDNPMAAGKPEQPAQKPAAGPMQRDGMAGPRGAPASPPPRAAE